MKLYIIGMVIIILTLVHEMHSEQNAPKPVDPTITELKKDIQTLASAIKFQQSEIKMLKRKIEKRR